MSLIGASILGGIVGSMGLGGAVVFNPVLLGLGVVPQVVSSTGVFLIMYSQLANTAVYILIGQLNVSYGLWIGGWCCIGVLFAQATISKVVKRTGRQSIIVCVLLIMMIAIDFMLPYFSYN